ncbi:MAG: helix-turn-helix domain-containing protein [Desulfovibrio sp.]|nr:helix-turn-helix domain-containing protein [Desulfovibrio sp.]
MLDLEQRHGRVLTDDEVAEYFRVDVRTIRRYAKKFGGFKIGRCLRFYENTIMSASVTEEGVNADKTQGPGEPVAGDGQNARPCGGNEAVRGRPQERAGVAQSSRVGRRNKTRAAEEPDAHGIRDCFRMGSEVPGSRQGAP